MSPPPTSEPPGMNRGPVSGRGCKGPPSPGSFVGRELGGGVQASAQRHPLPPIRSVASPLLRVDASPIPVSPLHPCRDAPRPRLHFRASGLGDVEARVDLGHGKSALDWMGGRRVPPRPRLWSHMLFSEAPRSATWTPRAETDCFYIWPRPSWPCPNALTPDPPQRQSRTTLHRLVHIRSSSIPPDPCILYIRPADKHHAQDKPQPRKQATNYP